MHKNLVLFIACVVALGGVIGLWWKNSEVSKDRYVENTELPGKGVTGNATNDSDPYDVTITYTEDGFKPSEITIKKGQRVRFLNKAKEGVWPASGIHPTHTLYPEKEETDCLGSSFDSCQDLKTGEFFDFTFYYVGTWRYHDHSHAYQTGSITVSAK